MRNVINIFGPYIASFAIMIVTASVNSCCMYVMYQPKLPKAADKYKH